MKAPTLLYYICEGTEGHACMHGSARYVFTLYTRIIKAHDKLYYVSHKCIVCILQAPVMSVLLEMLEYVICARKLSMCVLCVINIYS